MDTFESLGILALFGFGVTGFAIAAVLILRRRSGR